MHATSTQAIKKGVEKGIGILKGNNQPDPTQ